MVKCKEIKWSKLWVLNHEKGNDFYLSSWQRRESAIPLLILRLVLAALSCGILIWSLVHGSGPYWMIYLTNWGLLFMSGTMLSALLVSIMALRNTRVSIGKKFSLSFFPLFRPNVPQLNVNDVNTALLLKVGQYSFYKYVETLNDLT